MSPRPCRSPQHCGIVVTSATREKVEGSLAWRPEFGTTASVMHGGALMAFADTLGAMCAFLNLPAGAMTSTRSWSVGTGRPITATRPGVGSDAAIQLTRSSRQRWDRSKGRSLTLRSGWSISAAGSRSARPEE